jgi:RNA polymerase sigma-70 factor (ECF subfamily)
VTDAQLATTGEADLLARLRSGDEAAFKALVSRHYATMLAVAQSYVKGRSVAEEVVQETWR